MSFIRAVLFLLWLFVACVIGLAACALRPFGVEANLVAARTFSRGALKLLGLRLNVRGLENLHANLPAILAANHQSAVDMATFGAIIPPKTRVIGKTELKWIPLFGLLLWFAGNILIHRGRKDRAISGLDQAVEKVRSEGVSIFIFPEGTRNVSGAGLLPFKKGAFHMAIAAQIPVIPMVCSSLTDVAIFESLRLKGGEVTLTILPPVPTAGLTKADVDRLSETVREKMLATLSEKPLP